MSRRPRVLAVASGGGHWVQLLRLAPAFEGTELTFATTTPAYRETLQKAARDRGEPEPGYHVFVEANRWQKAKLLKQFLQLLLIILRVRPDAVITTGAAPGYLAIRIAGLMGARSCWIDSIANAEELSLSGAKVGPHADLWLTQWPDIARETGPHYKGAVL